MTLAINEHLNKLGVSGTRFESQCGQNLEGALVGGEVGGIRSSGTFPHDQSTQGIAKEHLSKAPNPPTLT